MILVVCSLLLKFWQVSNAELSPVLPPAVLSILTDNDSEEILQEEKTHSSYNKMVDAVSWLNLFFKLSQSDVIYCSV